MLRYKKHKRNTDGVAGSGVGVMDDTDREVSSFTDRAFRSLCVAEDELFNDVPHIPSPIRGMPLSTKYHLGIFNLSVRKTQPLAQLPTVPRHRGKWAPTFQPLLNSSKEGLIIAKTNTNKLCVPQPTGFKHHSKVSSLIKTFDNIENERPEQDGLFPCKSKIGLEEGILCKDMGQVDIKSDARQTGNPDDSIFNESRHTHRRTAREVFLESQAEISSTMSGSPCSLGSPVPDQVKKALKQKESLRRSAFLHSEHSAFKSWSDVYKRGESDISAPSTPPVLRSGTPCSPLLQRTTPRARDATGELGWASPASTASSSFDTIQMLRTVPPLPSKRTSKQNRDLSHRTPRVPLENKIPAEDMQVDVGYSQSPKEQSSMAATSKSPPKLHQSPYRSQNVETLQKPSQILPKTNEDIYKPDFKQASKLPEIVAREDDTKISNKHLPQSGRIKSLIQQIEKEAIKETSPLPSPEKKYNLKEPRETNIETSPIAVQELPRNPNPPVNNNVQVPPWRRRTEGKEKPLSKSIGIKESANEPLKENLAVVKDESLEDKSVTHSSFNIKNLLTPVIRRKSIQEALEEPPMRVSPPPANTPSLKDQEENMYLRNDYRAKATSLLFNLKDMRKRVKSTYNPARGQRNSDENIPTVDGRVPEVIMNHGIAMLDTIKQELEEDAHDNPQEYHPNLPSEKENNLGFAGNVLDNYLSLSSPPQVMQDKVIENGEIPTENLYTDENIDDEDMLSAQLSPIDNHISNGVDYPSLNLYRREDTSVNVEPKEIVNIEPEWRRKVGEMISQVENIADESNVDGLPEAVKTPIEFFLEEEMESEKRNVEQQEASLEMVRQWSIECEEDGNQEIVDDSLKGALQYYAVSDDKAEIAEQSEMLESEEKSKVEDREQLVCNKESEESRNTEEHKRPSSVNQFKSNLFHIKDITVRTSPVTKSVRPLLRSLSEDCLFYPKEENFSFTTGKRDFRVTRPSMWKSKDSKKKIQKTASLELPDEEKTWKPLSTQPSLESPNLEGTIKIQNKETNNQDIWDKFHHPEQQWIKREEQISEAVKVNKILHERLTPSLEGPFFHPVETCVSEVTGLSPECNTLFGHNISEPMKDLVNGDHVQPSDYNRENTNYSPLENGHFEDALSFSEDIVCSTITSPISESITCSMVASPMSVNTQSSGFTTALSAFDDMQSPPSSRMSSRDGKYSLPVLENVIPADNLKANISEGIKQLQEKAPYLDSENKAAKPPAVPPKTEKALRRAKRLTKKRRKTTEVGQKISDGEIKEADLVLDIPSPANIVQRSVTPQSHLKLGSLQLEETMSQSSTPSLPITQRKLLQDPESGQYFMVEIPVHYRIKTFYDPETGKYVQMSLPQSERSTPTREMSNTPCAMYQGLGPIPVASIASLKQASKLLNPIGFDLDCDSCDHSMAGTPQSMDRTASSTRSPDIISIRDLDDFAMEAIS